MVLCDPLYGPALGVTLHQAPLVIPSVAASRRAMISVYWRMNPPRPPGVSPPAVTRRQCTPASLSRVVRTNSQQWCARECGDQLTVRGCSPYGTAGGMIPLGTTDFRGQQKRFYIHPADLGRHLYVCGASGSG